MARFQTLINNWAMEDLKSWLRLSGALSESFTLIIQLTFFLKKGLDLILQ